MPGWSRDIGSSGLSGVAAGAIQGTLQTGQTALGTTQANAFPINMPATEFTTVASGTGAVLPTPGYLLSGDEVYVFNQGANALLVYPPLGFKIGTAGANAAVSVAAGKTAFFVARGDGNFFVNLSA